MTAGPFAQSPKFAVWAKSHKNELMVAGAGAVAATAFYVKSKSSSSAGTSSTTLTPATDDTTDTDYDTAFADQLAYLDSEVQGLTSTPQPTSSAPTIPAGQVANGSGYSNSLGGTVQATNGDYFSALTNWDDAQAIMSSGGSIDYESDPGVFTVYDEADLPSGFSSDTTLYQPVPTK